MMNFNQQPSNLSQVGNQSNNPQQQQQQKFPNYDQQNHPQQQQGGRMGNIPMLTPQLIQSLTPQQVQAMKSHPQFQEMMRNYMQRQQLLQQQQKTNVAGNMPQQNLQPQMTREQLMKQQFLLNQQRMAQGMSNSQNYQYQQPLQPPLQQQLSQMSSGNPQAQSIPPQLQQQQDQQQPQLSNFKGPGSRVSSIGAASSGINASPQIIPPTSSSSASASTSVGVLPNGAPINTSIPGVSPMIPGQTASQSISNTTTNQVSQDVLNKIGVKQLSSPHEWSDLLKKEGKDVPLDTKIYENIIVKDANFAEKSSNQIMETKSTMDKLNKDLLAYNQIKQLRMNSITLSQKNQLNNSIWGEGYQGYGNGITNSSTKLLFPDRDYTDKMINDTVSRSDSMNKTRQLIPIRLEFDQERDQFKLRDTFLWDLNEQILSVEDFTKQLIDDYKFIPRVHYETILSSIKEQISDYQQKPNKSLGELRIPIKIDVTINNCQLTDQFEWDILNAEENDPEEFARSLCDELYLPGEFSTAIAHSIREQSQMYYKALNIVGYSFDGSPVQEDEIRNRLLPSLRLVSQDYQVVDDFFSILRNPSSVPEYSPQLIKLTQLEVERLDKEMERESRRKRRHNYNEDQQTVSNGQSNPTSGSSGRSFTSRRIAAHVGRGNTIPDLSDIPKTFRTPAPSSILPGGVDLGVPDIYEYNEVYINRSQVKNPDYIPPTPEPKNNNRVFYEHDVLEGTFNVSIKLPV